MFKVLEVYRGYTIYDTTSLDTDSERSSRAGHIELVSPTVYCLKGDLPEMVNKRLAKIAEGRGLLYWFNNGKRVDAVSSRA